MNIRRVFILAIVSISFSQLAGCTSMPSTVSVKLVQQPKPKSFLQWCQEKDSSPADTKHTIDVLLRENGSKNCQIADIRLRGVTKLQLGSDNNIRDLKPISSLSNLKELDLNYSEVSDLTPLSNLIKLEKLNLADAKITDVKPLSNLTNLQELDIRSNHISNVSPLANLTKLQKLDLNSNKIYSVKPLSSLVDLKQLDLRYNRISDVSPLASLHKLTYLNLNSNNISDVEALSNLSNLKRLEILTNDGFFGIGKQEQKSIACPVKLQATCINYAGPNHNRW